MVHVLRCSGACRRRSGGKSANHTLRVSYYAAQRAISTGRGEWGESDSDDVEDIPRQPIEPRRSGRIRVPSQRKLENIRLSINTDEENGGESDSDEVEEIPRQPIEPRRSGRIRVPSQRALEKIRSSINTVFSSNQVPKSHEHMVRVLATLAGGYLLQVSGINLGSSCK